MTDGVLFAIAFLAGLVVGLALYERVLLRTARFERTGSPNAPVASVAPPVPVNAEAAAQYRASEHAIEAGADQLMAAAKAQNIPLKRKDALAQARAMLEGGSGVLE